MTHIREEIRAKINSSLVQQPGCFLPGTPESTGKYSFYAFETYFRFVQDIGDDPGNNIVWNCCHKHQPTP